MPFEQHGNLRSFKFESIPEEHIDHGVFTRRGGASEGTWSALNLGNNVGDDPEAVATNHRRLFEVLGRPLESTYGIWQVHSAAILVADGPRSGPPYPQADGVITDNPGVTLLLRFADCVPILLFDPVNHALGLIHAGWRGTVRRVATEAVRALAKTYGTEPGDLKAALGPSIHRHHYPVGEEVIALLGESLGQGAADHYEKLNGGYHLDLPGANRALLREAGVQEIELAPICTACHPEDWYSHRGEGPRTGRFGVVAALRP